MATQNPNRRNSLYPEVIQSNPNAPSPPNHSFLFAIQLYPSLDVNDLNDLVQDLFPEDTAGNNTSRPPSAPPEATEEVLLKIPGAILNLIDKEYSVELASGDFTVICLRQGDNAVAVYARVADEIQWPLAKDETAVKLDDSHYFFSFRSPRIPIPTRRERIAGNRMDPNCSSFSVQKVSEKAKKKGEALDGSVAKEISPKDLESSKKKEKMEGQCAAYWTTLAPNVEEYSSSAARMIAAGSGHVIKGILWCGDVTVDRLQWGNQVMKKRMAPGSGAEISPETLKRIKKGKKVTKMTQKVANGLLSGVVKVSGFLPAHWFQSL
ncbi:Senescence/spartin-associated [Sesbania bispinosa]|nr:Senescence/spartin-associated [Sesbania bispinosa]